MKNRSSYPVLSLAMLLLLSSCGAADSDPGPGGVSMEDARALDKAAAKLDAEQANPEKEESKDD